MDKSVEQGAAFHDESIRALRLAGFEIASTKCRLEDVGIELDAITNNRHGIAFAWEFKGSLQGARPGLRRTDTLKKAIANGFLLSVSEIYGDRFPPLFVMCSHIPVAGDGQKMMAAALRSGVLSDIVDSRDGVRLGSLANITEEGLRVFMQTRALLPSHLMGHW